MDTTVDHFTPLALRVRGNDSFGKGFDVLKDHVLNRLMTGCCPPYITAVNTAEVPLAFSPKQLQFSKKSATFKTLKSSPRMY